MNDTAGLRLTVRAAEKRDAGRGIARLPESSRKRLGLLSGDTVEIRGERTAVVAKVWPGGADAPEGSVLIDADTRANAGVKVGDAVTVAAVDVEDADRIVLAAPAELADVDVSREVVERALARDLRDRPVTEGEAVHVERARRDSIRRRRDGPGGHGARHEPDRRVGEIRGRGRVALRRGRGAGSPDCLRIFDGERSLVRQIHRHRHRQHRHRRHRHLRNRRPPARRHRTPAEHTAGATYEDIGGLDEELELVRETIELPLSGPACSPGSGSTRRRASCSTARRGPGRR